MAHQWHTKGPAKLISFNVIANRFAINGNKAFEPVAHRLCA
jgi:hypothetical protein